MSFATLVLCASTYALLNLGNTLNQNNVNLSKGLVGYWPLDGNADDSVGSNNGVPTNITYVADRKGAANGSAVFNGSTSNISTNSTGLPTGSNDRSDFAWVKLSSCTGPHNIYPIDTWGNTTGNGYTSSLALEGSGACHVSFEAQQSRAYSSLILPLNSWHFIGYTYSAGSTSATIYMDGNSEVVPLSNGVIINTPSGSVHCMGMWVGCSSYATTTGSIADVRIYNRALSQVEATALYNTYSPHSSVQLDSSQTGLIGWWKLNGNTKDSTPYANNGTWTGTPTYTTDRKGAANGAASFDGSSYIDLGSHINVPTTMYTISAWIYHTGTDAYPTILDRYGNENSDCLGFGFSGYQYLGVANGPLTHSPPSTGIVPLNTWVYVAATYNNGTVNYYINGVNAGTITGQGTPCTFGDFIIGANLPGGDEYFGGKISDVRLYNRALAPQEIKTQYQAYNSGINLNSYGMNQNLSVGLVGYWPFNGNALDKTVYQDNGTINGSTTLSSDRNGRANSAYVFDGSTGYIATNAVLPTNAYTKAAWVYITHVDPSHEENILSGSGGTPFWVSGNNLEISNNWTSGGALSVPITYNVWHLVTGTYDSTINGGTLKLYIDGTLVRTGTNFAPPANHASKQCIGCFGVSQYLFSGYMDDVRLYNRTLSAAEVQALYNTYY